MTMDSWDAKLFSGGWIAPRGGRLVVREPATGEPLAEVGQADGDDMRAACARAAAAQPGWAEEAPAARAAILRRAAAFFEANAARISQWIVRETGAVRGKAAVELQLATGALHQAAAMALEPPGLVLPSDAGITSLARRVPHGVVGIISPFNFPLILSARALAPALAAGNAAVLKPDPRTPVSGGLLLARAFEEAGLPDGVLHVLPGGAEAGEALVGDADVAMISFTGSTAAGRRVAALAAPLLKPVSLELGGKNALIVLDDADLDRAASCTAWGAFLHQGQICMATGRVLVPEALAEDFATRLAERADRLGVGDPWREEVALGPLIDAAQAARAATLVEASVAAGARLLTGGGADGAFVRPTVLDRVAPGMPVFDEEIFGPVAPITTYRDEADAARLANLGAHGLSAGIVGASMARGLDFAKRLRTGIVHVNDQTVADEPWAPFGGNGASGGGRHGGPANWETFTRWQWTTMRAAPPAYPF
jgi:benzaldehyde dehydrogenase (NAD)